MPPITPPDFARRDALAAAELLKALSPHDEAYPLALAACLAAQDALALSLSLWEEAGNHDKGEGETYRRRKASKDAALEGARQRWKVDAFVRGNRYARKKLAYARKARTGHLDATMAPAIHRDGPQVPLVADGQGGPPAPLRTFREWRAAAREESLAKGDAAAVDALRASGALVELP